MEDKKISQLLRQWKEIGRRWVATWPPKGWVQFGSLRRLRPISNKSGWDRGLPIDRYYMEKFLSNYALDICGHVLEMEDAKYIHKFGKDRVSKSDVLHLTNENRKATIIADLTSADNIASDTFDCIICTQTLQMIYDVRAAIKTLHRILKPGGVLLATISGISPIARYDMERWGEYWRVTSRAAQKLFEEFFLEDVVVKAYGNVLAATAFMHGLSTEELTPKELDYNDPDYEMVITIHAKKQSG